MTYRRPYITCMRSRTWLSLNRERSACYARDAGKLIRERYRTSGREKCAKRSCVDRIMLALGLLAWGVTQHTHVVAGYALSGMGTLTLSGCYRRAMPSEKWAWSQGSVEHSAPGAMACMAEMANVASEVIGALSRVGGWSVRPVGGHLDHHNTITPSHHVPILFSHLTSIAWVGGQYDQWVVT